MRDRTLAILAGGDGSRMGGPKGLIRIGDKPILAWLLDRLTWAGPTLLVTAPQREHPPAWEAFDREVTDPVAGLGPLRGILTALEHATTDHVLVLTVDMPAVGRDQLIFLAERLGERPHAAAIFPRRGDITGSRLEPFPCILRRAAAPAIAQRLAENRRSVGRLTDDPRFAVVDAPPDWADCVWTNLNEPAELALYVAGLSAHRQGAAHEIDG